MKKQLRALNKDIFREIRNTFSRFMSIFLLSMLGVAFLAGLKTSAPSMKLSVSQYYDDQSLMDFRLTSTLGLTNEDVNAANDLAFVNFAEGTYTVDAFMDAGESEYVVKVHTVGGTLNQPSILEGRLPQTSGECVIEKITTLDLKIGDTINLRTSGSNYENFLSDGEFTIVGIIQSPEYISLDRGTSTLGSGAVDFYLYLSPSAFESEVYTDIVLTVNGSKGLNRYGSEYKDLIDSLAPQLENFIEERVDMRYQTLYTQARAELDKGWQEYESSKDAADNDLESARITLENFRAELDSGWAAYNNAKVELDAEIANMRSELDSQWAQYNAANAQVSAARTEFESNRTEILSQLNNSQNEVDAGMQQLSEMREQLDLVEQSLASLEQQINELTDVEGAEARLSELQEQYNILRQQYDDNLSAYQDESANLQRAQAEIDSTRYELEQVEQNIAASESQMSQTLEQLNAAEYALSSNSQADELETARNELEIGEAEYADALDELNRQYEDVTAEFEDALAELEAAEAELSQLQSGIGYALDLTQTTGFSSFGDDADRVGALANVFPIIFFLVAALVCLTTITRMVDEKRAEIGTLKALGYSKWSVAKKYIVYASAASLTGSVAGILLGCWVIPKVIFTSYSILYTMPDMILRLIPSLCILSCLAAVLSTTIAAFAAVSASLRAYPAELMRPRAPKPGKRVFLERIPFIWNHLSFIKKVTARNLFRYKKRLLMTVIGIGGCTALLITGFGLQDSIFAIINRQFENVSKYDLTAIMNPQSNIQDFYSTVDTMNENELVTGCLTAYQNSYTLSGNRHTANAYIFATDDTENFTNYIILRDRKSGGEYSFPQHGAVITEKLSELLGLTVGDTLTLDNEGHSVQISGITENYIYHYVYMSAEYYAEVFGQPWEPNCFLIKTVNDDQSTIDELSESLISSGTIITVSNIKGMANSFTDSLNVVNYAVLVIIISAAALAFVVLYNLTNINITERKRELATIKVLGFYDWEVSSYVYRENIVLTFMGMILGVILGFALHSWLVRTIEVDMVMFGRTADASSYIYALLLTLLFSVLVNFAAHRKLKKIDMVESLKSVE